MREQLDLKQKKEFNNYMPKINKRSDSFVYYNNKKLDNSNLGGKPRAQSQLNLFKINQSSDNENV